MKLNSLYILALTMFVLGQSCKKEDDSDNEPKIIVASFDNSQFKENTCAEKDSLRSFTGAGTDIFITNKTNEILKVYWINFTGELVSYDDELLPGDTYTVNTFLTHPWYISKADETCITIVTCLLPNTDSKVSLVYE